MKPRNAIVTLLLAMFVPFYIYYWLYDTGKGMQRTGVRGVPTILPLLVVTVLYFISIVGLFIGTIIEAVQQATTGSSNTTPPSALFLVAFVFIPVIWVLSVVYYYKFSQAASKLVNLEMSAGLMTVIMVLYAPAGIFLVQEKSNQRFYPQTPQPPLPPQPGA